jgi:hypothetical protein
MFTLLSPLHAAAPDKKNFMSWGAVRWQEIYE